MAARLNSRRFRLPMSSLVILAPLLLMASPSVGFAEWTPGKHMTTAVNRVMRSVKSIGDISNYGYDNGICIMAAFLRPSATSAFNRPMTRGQKYIVLGGGDEDTEDLDIEILDSDGNVVGKDVLADASPIVRFTAPKSGTFTIRQKLYKAKTGCFCVVAVLREGGFDVPLKNLETASTKLIRICGIVDSKITGSVAFHDVSNQWALFGTILKAGEEQTITNMTLGSGDRIMVAAGDNNTTDIDLYALNSDDKVFAKDEDDDANPYLKFKATGGQYGMKIKNVKTRGPAMVLTAILKVD